ncbi:putative disease resistance protein At1g58400 [Primulina tabacum]|uniref:putative disease resistance protein At1g58400 n=1 Tax=Primulina tabacum TaxID=48773 RepID=UPI003F5A8910
MTMQVTIAMVSAVMARTEQLMLEEEGAAPMTKWDSQMREMVQNLLSDIRSIVQRYLFLLVRNEDEMNQDEAKQKKILGLAYDFENSVESYFVKNATCASSGGRFTSLFKRSHAKRLLDTLQGFRLRVDAIRDSDLLPIPVSEVSMPRPDYVLPVSRTMSWSDRASTSSVSAVDDFVAPSEVIVVQRDVQKLLSILISNDTGTASSSFVSICGKRGLGKTTLAKLVYNNTALVEHFDGRAWASVRSDAPIRDILESILISLSPTPVKKEVIFRMDPVQSRDEVYKAQKGRRCFIVFDDVSSIDTIKFVFPMISGTKMLITTRSSEVAGQLNGYIHHMKELTLEESNMLFKCQSEISEHQEGTARQMEIGAQIAGACGGIPLAIAVVGRILRGKNFDEWNRVLERLQDPGDVVMNVLCLSYKYLPLHLKPCFLYLAHLLLDQVMPVEKLYLLWMAEGLISKETLHVNIRMNVAEEYLKKLIFTSLVIAETENESAVRRFKSCQLQGLVHDICVSFGVKENFFQVINTSYQAEISSVYRVAIYLNIKDGDKVYLKINEPKNMRALLFFETDESPPAKKWPTGVDDLAAFQWMRVLNFDKVDFVVKKLPDGLGKLRYLRYLSFQGCNLNELPSFVSKLKLLEILDLRVAKACRLIISDNHILKKVTRLSHLYLPSVFQTIAGNLKLRALRRLELLENFNSMSCDMDDLLELTLLQIVTVDIAVGLPKDLNKIIEFVRKNKHLRQVSLVIKDFDCYHSEERLSIFKTLWDLAPLHALHVEGHMKTLSMNPNIEYSRVTEIVFDESEFDSDPMPILGRLRNLRSLVLQNDAFVGHSMVCCESGFGELRRLELKNLRFLENWVVEEGAMAKLSVLVIKDCKKLAMAPIELMDTGTLRELKIISMPKIFEETIRRTFQRMEGLIVTFDN